MEYPDKYLNIFLISSRKLMVYVLIKINSQRQYYWLPITSFCEEKKKYQKLLVDRSVFPQVLFSKPRWNTTMRNLGKQYSLETKHRMFAKLMSSNCLPHVYMY